LLLLLAQKKASQPSLSENNVIKKESLTRVIGSNPVPTHDRVRAVYGARTDYGNGVYLCNGSKGLCFVICTPSNSEQQVSKTIYTSTETAADLEYREYISDNEYIISFAKQLIVQPVANGVTYYPTY
jgi:hypothetical protein